MLEQVKKLAETLKAVQESLSKDKDGSAPFSSDIERQLMERMERETRDALVAIGESPESAVMSLSGQDQVPKTIQTSYQESINDKTKEIVSRVLYQGLVGCVMSSDPIFGGGLIHASCLRNDSCCNSNAASDSCFNPGMDLLKNIIFKG